MISFRPWTRLLLLLLVLPGAAAADLSIRFLDVGQGDATLIRTSAACAIGSHS